MIIYNDSLSLEVRVTDYEPTTTYGIEWEELSNGNWIPTTLGSDVYESKLSIAGSGGYIHSIAHHLEHIRSVGGMLYLSGFASNELAFGADVDYTSPLSGILTDYKLPEQTSFRLFKTELELRLISPSLQSASLIPAWSWNAVDCISHSYKFGRDYPISAYDTYDGLVYGYDHRADEGTVELTLNLTDTQVCSLRAWHRTQRGASFTLPISGLLGVDYPFGIEAGLGPHTARLRSLKEASRFGLSRQLVKVKLIEER